MKRIDESRIQNLNGADCPILAEPSLVRINYEMIWMKRKIDLRELAKLRESGLSLREIQRVLGAGKTTIWRKLRKLSGDRIEKLLRKS